MSEYTTTNLVNLLLEADAIQISLNKIKTASGVMTSVYLNIGDRVISFPRVKDFIVGALADTFQEHGRGNVDRLIGVPEGMNCLVSSLSDRLMIGQLRVRESISGHGDQKTIEGVYSLDQHIAIFEDVFTSGNSTIGRAINPLIAAGLHPSIVIGLVDRQRGGPLNIQNQTGIPVHSFTTLSKISAELVKGNTLSNIQLELLKEENRTLNIYPGNP